VGNAGDLALEFAGHGYDVVFSTIDHTLGSHFEHLELLGSGAVSGIGNALYNSIQGSVADNVIEGRGGDDFLLGHAGNDVVLAATARMRCTAGPANLHLGCLSHQHQDAMVGLGQVHRNPRACSTPAARQRHRCRSAAVASSWCGLREVAMRGLGGRAVVGAGHHA
jgi:Ca2+-binding RTX toxin-like protein